MIFKAYFINFFILLFFISPIKLANADIDHWKSLEKSTRFLRFSCTPKVKPHPEFDSNFCYIATHENKVAYGSGVLLSQNGHIITTYHSLADLIKTKSYSVNDLIESGKVDSSCASQDNIEIKIGCDLNDAEIGVFSLNQITAATSQAEPDFIVEYKNTDFSEHDILFIKVNTNNIPLSHRCIPKDIEVNDLHEMEALALGVDIELENNYQERKGRTTANKGEGESEKYLKMDIPVTKGMSGGPIIRKTDGALVGIIHGNRPRKQNPLATDNFFIPLTKFRRHIHEYHSIAPCEPINYRAKIAVAKHLNYKPREDSVKFMDAGITLLKMEIIDGEISKSGEVFHGMKKDKKFNQYNLQIPSNIELDGFFSIKKIDIPNYIIDPEYSYIEKKPSKAILSNPTYIKIYDYISLSYEYKHKASQKLKEIKTNQDFIECLNYHALKYNPNKVKCIKKFDPDEKVYKEIEDNYYIAIKTWEKYITENDKAKEQLVKLYDEAAEFYDNFAQHCKARDYFQLGKEELSNINESHNSRLISNIEKDLEKAHYACQKQRESISDDSNDTDSSPAFPDRENCPEELTNESPLRCLFRGRN